MVSGGADCKKGEKGGALLITMAAGGEVEVKRVEEKEGEDKGTTAELGTDAADG